MKSNLQMRSNGVMAAQVLLLVLSTGIAGVAQDGPRVTIDAGMIAGTHFGPEQNEFAFLGIPYAAPPIGGLRWRPPERPSAWKGTRQTTAYGAACPQLPSPWLPEMLSRKEMVTDEACLYLNVWTTNLSASTKLPVMFWIHGGGNIEGSQEWPPLGAVLAKHGVVVVTMNYRLGILGYFSHPALAAESPQHSSGNYGLLDQIEALKWVHRNIEKFGGDSAHVTVFGASSGSLDICDLMASPLAAGLFQRAILQSGVCVDGLSPLLKNAVAEGARLARDFGATVDAQALTTLRALPADKLVQAAAQRKDIDPNPVVDGWVLPEQPARTFAKGEQAKIPVIVGSNLSEVTIFSSPLVGGKSYRPKSVADYRHWLDQTFKQGAPEVFAAYPARNDREVRDAFIHVATDSDFGFGTWLLAREVTAAGQKAYLYNFSYAGAGEFAPLGAFHSEESILLSKKYWTRWVSSPDDEKLSNILIGYWVHFAKTGEPGGDGLPPWEAYDPKIDRCQDLGRYVGQISTPRSGGFHVFEEMLKEQMSK